MQYRRPARSTRALEGRDKLRSHVHRFAMTAAGPSESGKIGTEALDLNQTFHFALAEIADMTVLRGILNRLWLQMGPLIATSYSQGGRVMIDHHYVILAAIEARDPDAAERAIAEDIGGAGAIIIDRLRAHEQDTRRGPA